MNRNTIEFEELEKVCRKVVNIVLLTCEAELFKHNDEVKGLPSAAMAVRESILTFLSLVSQK